MADAKKPDVAHLLADLASLTETLNCESDSINDSIKHFQAVLVKMNPGLEVWVKVLSEEEDLPDPDDEEKSVPGLVETELGFAKLYHEWTLAVRDVTYRQGVDPYSGTTTWARVDEDRRILLDASREERIAAMAHFPRLLIAMKDSVEKAIQTIRDAKAFIEQC